MFGKKKTKRASNVSNCAAKASNMTSGSRSTKSCSSKASNTGNSTDKACHNTRGASNSKTKSCS